MEYFSIIIEFDIQKVEDKFVKNFYDLLEKSGMSLTGGYWKAEGLSLEEIIKTNQEYIQSAEPNDGEKWNPLFNYCGLSGIRGFWRVDKFWNILEFHILIPEYCLFANDIKNTDTMNALIRLAESIWSGMPVLLIQTMWECSGIPAKYRSIRKGTLAKAEPFAIVSKSIYRDEWNYETTETGNEGYILRDDNNWFQAW